VIHPGSENPTIGAGATVDDQDRALARRARAGSMAAFAGLVQRYQQRVYNLHLRRVGCGTEAEDLTQETFLRAWRRIEQYDPNLRFGPWLFTIAMRLASNHRRAHGRRSRLLAMAPARGPQWPDAARAALVREEAEHVWDLAEGLLGHEQRTALWLRYAEGLSTEELARVLGKSRLATRVMLFRARHRLAAHLQERPEDKPSPAADIRTLAESA
jgi:RNA polymerase sigma-70 factor (ECF subfamily)